MKNAFSGILLRKISHPLYVRCALTLISAMFLTSTAAAGSWYYNFNAGFGIYVADGWRSEENGRSAEVTGPERDLEQSRIFLGSDWVEKIKDAASLSFYMQNELGLGRLKAIRFSGLDGFRYGTPLVGGIYLLRGPANVVEIEYELKGSKDQIDEGKTSLSSIEIRTKLAHLGTDDRQTTTDQQTKRLQRNCSY